MEQSGSDGGFTGTGKGDGWNKSDETIFPHVLPFANSVFYW